jgi:hypothetical protein
MSKSVLANVEVEEVDSLTYGELAALYNSASALNVDGPYVFITYDDNLYIGEYEEDNLRVYRVIAASHIDVDAVKLALEIFRK